MVRSLSHSKTKRAPRKATAGHRRTAQGNLKLLTAFRCLEGGTESRTGFVRALNLSTRGALLESPDEFEHGQMLALEFLLDNNRIAHVEGRVTRVTARTQFYHIVIEFDKLTPQARRLIDLQVSA